MALKFLKAPPPNVVLLPDTQFFVRAIPVSEDQTPEELSTQVELALETLAPFPIAQMYYGYHWRPGARHALIHAAYRKRFSQASVETWPAADAVLPAFATLLNPAAGPGTTALLSTPDSLTAIHWADSSGVPALVISRAYPEPDDDKPPLSETDRDAARAALRNELLRATPGTIHLHEYEYPALDTVPPPARADNALVFATPPAKNTRTTPSTTTFTTAQLDMLDVRDKAELVARRASRRRDLLLWRAFLGCLSLLALCALIDIALKGGKFLQEKRIYQVKEQAPHVAEIDRANTLATRIEDLSTKRLLPFEMIDLLRPALPDTIVFTRVITRSLNSIEIQARTNRAADFNSFRTSLVSLPAIEKLDINNPATRDGSTTFTMLITFKPGTVIAAEDIPPPQPKNTATPKTDAANENAAENAAPQPGASQSAAPSIHDQIQQQLTPGQSETPPPDAAPSANGQSAPLTTEHTIVTGDTIARIARQAGVSPRDIIAANPGLADPRRLHVGQKINIPQPAPQPANETAEEEPNQ
ncbi:LysM repeat protein [Ereboglobus sp. PH5-10]|uniref:LysM peptidoglycan-binding domain-containing protein n=1 Tax=Ereboglobus sp. PH5-10 TaxID=2940629 RepID=UPI002404AD69|nr:LysM peptidoglycan-binding domain-containing protein [Ereboglobus sp. PH5-10]MDF9826127.1 LysM repeat protein [Ereboglobus sp. PH5-10]